jgi:hypothetical protein
VERSDFLLIVRADVLSRCTGTFAQEPTASEVAFFQKHPGLPVYARAVHVEPVHVEPVQRNSLSDGDILQTTTNVRWQTLIADNICGNLPMRLRLAIRRNCRAGRKRSVRARRNGARHRRLPRRPKLAILSPKRLLILPHLVGPFCYCGMDQLCGLMRRK